MPDHAGIDQRLSELIAKIETEQNRAKFTALVEELNCLLDSDLSGKKQPAQPNIDDPCTRQTPPTHSKLALGR